MEFTLFTGSKSISVNGYTLVADIPLIIPINTLFGALYNWWSVNNANEIAPAGWHKPDIGEFTTLQTYLGGVNDAGGHMKNISSWTAPNTGADNSSKFNALGSGITNSFMVYSGRGLFEYMWSENSWNPTSAYIGSLNYSNSKFLTSGVMPKYYGLVVRCINDATTLSDGETGTVTDIDGNIYQTICIDNQEFMSENLKVRHYRNGTTIPVLSDPALWGADTTGAMCHYNNMP